MKPECRKNLDEMYNNLLERYGKQNWWPATKKAKASPEYFEGKRSEKQKIEIIFGAILTQNTSWKNVEKAITNLNKHDLIDVKKIIRIEQKKLAELIKPSGYYNQKAKKLKNIAVFLRKYPISQLEKMPLAEARKLLLDINGVGKETADSILLYALNKPIFVVDAYTKRIFSRLGLIKIDGDYDKVQKLFMKNLPHDGKIYNEYHALIVEHAKRHCRKKPECGECLLAGYCNDKDFATV